MRSINRHRRTAKSHGNDLRGLGICHQQAFSQVFRVRKICENEPSVQEGIACRYCPEYVKIMMFRFVDHELKKILALEGVKNSVSMGSEIPLIRV